MLKDPSAKYRPFPPVHLPDRQWPSRTLTRAPDLVQRGPPRWQPGAGHPDERRPEARAVPDAREVRLQGNRGRLPLGLEHRVHLQPPADRGTPRPGRRVAPGAGAGARGFDRAHLRVAGRREEGHHSPLQLDLPGAAPGGVRHVQGGNPPRGRARRQVDPGAPAPAQGHGSPAPVFARELQRHRGRVRQGSRRSRHGGLEAHAAAQDDPEPARHGRGGHAQRLCGPDRVDLPQHQEPRLAHHQPAHPQRPLHRRGGDGIGPARRRGPRRRHPLRQRRAHRQPRHRDRRPEPLHAGH